MIAVSDVQQNSVLRWTAFLVYRQLHQSKYSVCAGVRQFSNFCILTHSLFTLSSEYTSNMAARFMLCSIMSLHLMYYY